MKLTLDYTQRLNLHALMGAQRASLDEMRMLWRLQDQIELTAEEKAAIDYKVVEQNGQSQVLWNPNKNLPLKEYELADVEFQRMARTLREWQPGFLIGADRRWIEPLMAQFDGALASKGNGDASKKEMGLGGMAPQYRHQ